MLPAEPKMFSGGAVPKEYKLPKATKLPKMKKGY